MNHYLSYEFQVSSARWLTSLRCTWDQSSHFIKSKTGTSLLSGIHSWSQYSPESPFCPESAPLPGLIVYFPQISWAPGFLTAPSETFILFPQPAETDGFRGHLLALGNANFLNFCNAHNIMVHSSVVTAPLLQTLCGAAVGKIQGSIPCGLHLSCHRVKRSVWRRGAEKKSIPVLCSPSLGDAGCLRNIRGRPSLTSSSLRKILSV